MIGAVVQHRSPLGFRGGSDQGCEEIQPQAP